MTLNPATAIRKGWAQSIAEAGRRLVRGLFRAPKVDQGTVIVVEAGNGIKVHGTEL